MAAVRHNETHLFGSSRFYRKPIAKERLSGDLDTLQHLEVQRLLMRISLIFTALSQIKITNPEFCYSAVHTSEPKLY